MVVVGRLVGWSVGGGGRWSVVLDAITSFVGARHRRRVFRGLRSGDSVGNWRSTRRMSIPPQHALHVLDERKGPNLEEVR